MFTQTLNHSTAHEPSHFQEDSYMFLYQALVEKDESAWEVVKERYSPQIASWLHQRWGERWGSQLDEKKRGILVHDTLARFRKTFARHPQKFDDFPNQQALLGLLHRLALRSVMVVCLLFCVSLSVPRFLDVNPFNLSKNEGETYQSHHLVLSNLVLSNLGSSNLDWIAFQQIQRAIYAEATVQNFVAIRFSHPHDQVVCSRAARLHSSGLFCTL